MKKNIVISGVILIVLSILLINVRNVYAQVPSNYTSASYILSDPVFGEAGPYSQSTNFKEKNTLGQLVTGVSQSTNFILKSGFEYYSGQSVPSITMSINTNSINFGNILPGTIYKSPTNTIVTISSNSENGYNLYVNQNNNLQNQQGDSIPPVNNGATTTAAAPYTSTSYNGLGYSCSTSNSFEQAVLANTPIGFWSLGETSGTTAYDLSGNNNNGTYYATLRSWTTTTSLPASTAQATSVEYNGYVYEIGGCSSTCPTTTVDYAPINSNGTLGTWTTTTSLPAATWQATSVVYNGYVYEIGGNNGTASVVTVDFAPINNNGTLGSWTATTSLPVAINSATSVVYNGYVYEIGGNNGSANITTVDYAPINSNGTLGSWTATTSLPVAINSATSVVYNGYVYEIGGNNGTASVVTVDFAPINSNGTLGSWTTTTPLPEATNQATSVVYNGYVYEIGGCATSCPTTTLDFAPINNNGTLGSWTATTSLPATTDGPATSVVYNGYVYEIGGWNGGANVTTVDYINFLLGYTQGKSGPISNQNLGKSTYFNGPTAPGEVTGSLPQAQNTNTTITVWARYPSLTSHGEFVHIGLANGYGIGIGNSTFGTVGNQVLVLFDETRWIPTGFYIQPGSWHFYTLVLNSSGYPTVYVDGRQIYTDSNGAPRPPSPDFSIANDNGGYTGTSRFFQGELANVAIYNSALTQSQIQTIFNAGINNTSPFCNSDFINSNYYRQLSSTPTEFASYSSIANNQSINVNYAVNITNTQASGNYTNTITYTVSGNY